MRWIEKRPKGPDANIRQSGPIYEIRVRLRLPDGKEFRRELTAGSKTAARRVRDDVYAAYNGLALEILAGKPVQAAAASPDPDPMTLRELAETCRDSWWPARGRSPDVAEQYYQKLRDYVFPVLGEDCTVGAIRASDWDRVLASAKEATTNRGGPMGTATIRKVKAVLSSALSCAAANGRIPANPIRGIPYDPHPLAEADRLGVDAGDLVDEESPAKRPLSDADAETLLAASKGTGIYPLVVLQLGFGLRIAEALAVRRGDFDAEANELRVRFQVRRRRNPKWKEGDKETKTILQRVPVLKSKAGRREILVMPDAAALLATLPPGGEGETLARTAEGGLMEPRNAQRAFSAVVDGLVKAKKMAEPRPTTHSMRSWRLSHWANVVGLPASHLMRLAGHSNIETTMRYYVRSDRDSLRQWLEERGGPSRSPLAAAPPPPRAP